MFTIDEIIKLKNEGFTAEDIVELSNIKMGETQPVPVETKEVPEETKAVPSEEKEETKAVPSEELKESNPINELNSFNDKIDELINQIKINNINKQYIETPKEMTGMDILANVINPKTREEIK